MNFNTIIPISAFLIGALMGHTFTKHYYEAQIAEIKAEALTQDVKALENKHAVEQIFKNAQDEHEQTAQGQYLIIRDKYNSAIADDGLYNEGGSTNAPTVPGCAVVTCKVTDSSEYRRLRQDYDHLKRRCLQVARERDEIAVDRNELIQLYQSIGKN